MKSGNYTEIRIASFSGWPVLGLTVAYALLGILALIAMLGFQSEVVSPMGNVVGGLYERTFPLWSAVVAGLVWAGGSLALCAGFFSNEPNNVKVISLAGEYRGVAAEEGLRWYWPWFTKHYVSKRLENFSTPHARVNDKLGNPIDIAAVVVWKVEDAAKASYLVEDYERFVMNQSEVALRVLASQSYYDAQEAVDKVEVAKVAGDESAVAEIRASDSAVAERGVGAVASDERITTLIENRVEAGREMAAILSDLLGDIGVSVETVNITHLAYAPEIAGVMLKRQAATALVAARKTLLDGSAGIVDDLLKRYPDLSKDEDRKYALMGNLLTVLVADTPVTPVVNVTDVRG